jgi:fatty-acyl-CoA synthase
MFISGGENVYPVEIESVLYQHPAVHQGAVVGIPDAKWGEVGHACVVVRPGASLKPAELIEFMAGRLARHKVPKSVTLFEALPLSAAGKILKRELREKLVRAAD